MSYLPLVIITLLMMISGDFKKDQLRFERVRQAYADQEESAKSVFQKHDIEFDQFEIFLRAYKEEEELQLFARKKGQGKYTLIKTYAFCMLSGELGPKRKQGDYQVPEGFYHIDRFNPASNFYLSLGINYPNASDRILGKKGLLGGDIFIHGDCVSIGCIPITDPLIKELYLICVEAKDQGQAKIPVHIFPTRMNNKGMAALKSKHNDSMYAFWKNLKIGHDQFEKTGQLPSFKVATDGKYLFENF